MSSKTFAVFLKEMMSDWTSSITGAASIPFTVLCLYVSGATQRVAFGITAVILFFFSAYRTWLKEYSRAEKEFARAESEVRRAEEALAKPRITSADWQAMSEQFRLPHLNTRADYQTSEGETTWRVVANPSCEALCRKAGAMLRNSPTIFAQLHPPVSTESDDVARWCEYLKLRFGAESVLYGSDATTGKIVMWAGMVSAVQDRSVILCTELSAALI